MAVQMGMMYERILRHEDLYARTFTRSDIKPVALSLSTYAFVRGSPTYAANSTSMGRLFFAMIFIGVLFFVWLIAIVMVA
jgi:hypothetical protein